MPPHLADECFSGSDSGFSHCYYEWFVKWTGLGYEHATWEFENSSFLTSIEAKGLIENYETRHEEVNKTCIFARLNKVFHMHLKSFNCVASYKFQFVEYRPFSSYASDSLVSINVVWC